SENFAVRGDHAKIRMEGAQGRQEWLIAKALRLKHGYRVGLRHLFDRRRMWMLAAAARAIGLGHNAGNVVWRAQQRFQRGHGEFRSAKKDNSQGVTIFRCA